MDLAIWIAISAGVLAALAPITQGGLRKINDKELGKYVRKAGLPLPTHLREPLLQRIAGRERWALYGGAIGMALAVVTSLVFGWRDTTGGMLVMLAVVFGGSLGGVIAILSGSHQLRREGPRMARAQATELSDYVIRGELLSARLAPIAALVPAIVGAVLLTMLPHGPAPELTWWTGMAWTAAGLTVLALIATELVARLVLARPQHAESRLELAWDDVCRAESLRGLVQTPIAMGVLAALSSLIMVGLVLINPDIRSGAMQQTFILGMVMLAVSGLAVLALLLPAMISWLSGGRSFVLRQLWAGEDFSTDARERTC